MRSLSTFLHRQTDFSTAHVTHSSVQGWIITGFDFEIEHADGAVKAPGMVGPFTSCGEAEATLLRLREQPQHNNDAEEQDEPDDICSNPGGLMQLSSEVTEAQVAAVAARFTEFLKSLRESLRDLEAARQARPETEEVRQGPAA